MTQAMTEEDSRMEERRRRTVPSPSALGDAVVYPGPSGSHTAAAAAALFPSAELRPLVSFGAQCDVKREDS